MDKQSGQQCSSMLSSEKALEKSPTHLKELQVLAHTGRLRDEPNSPKEAVGQSHRG